MIFEVVISKQFNFENNNFKAQNNVVLDCFTWTNTAVFIPLLVSIDVARLYYNDTLLLLPCVSNLAQRY